jgi:hypothetical protein
MPTTPARRSTTSSVSCRAAREQLDCIYAGSAASGSSGGRQFLVEKMTKNGNLVIVKNWGQPATLSERDRAGSAGLPARRCAPEPSV